MAIGKRGMFFTLIMILLLITVVISVSFPKAYYLKTKSFVTDTRITNMDRFVEDLKIDINRALYISSFRALLAMSQYIATEGNYMPDVSENFKELMLEETLNGSIYNVTKSSGFNNWISRVQSEADQMDIILNISVYEVDISQSTPWAVNVVLNSRVDIVGRTGLAEWHFNQTASTVVDILEFEDPIYTIKSNGTFLNTIKRTVYQGFVNLTDNDTTNLSLHLDDMYYIPSSDAPSFLNRMAGDFNASPLGIESLVDVDSIFSATMRFNKTAVDYIYWSSDNPLSSRIDKMSSSFRLDNTHLERYNCTGLIIPG